MASPRPCRALPLALGLALLLDAPRAEADRPTPRLHEPIPPDPRDDLAHSMTLVGNLPAAIDTPAGLVVAPDATKPLGKPGETRYAPAPRPGERDAMFRPDRNTARPGDLPYEDPFTPPTAPFKRLTAYDTVNADYTLSVRDPSLTRLELATLPPSGPSEDRFFADLVVVLEKGKKTRIPSVGPGARVLQARSGVQSEEAQVLLFKDGAENWFVEGEANMTARLVMELAVPHEALAEDFGNPSRAMLGEVPPLPANVRASAAVVCRKLGVSRNDAPAEVVRKLVDYFRAFRESNERPEGRGDIYLDLALQQKGVCRHRAFAFLVTALSLGIPTRMVTSEVHAWVEVFDGHLWHRIDLGGAGGTRNEAAARSDAPSGGNESQLRDVVLSGPDRRPSSTVTLSLAGPSARRGAPLSVRGTVSAEGKPCGQVAVEIVLGRGTERDLSVGVLATDASGTFSGVLVVPPNLRLGNYEARARTLGDARCGRGEMK